MKHPATYRAEVAVSRATRALIRLYAKREDLLASIAEAENNLREAQYDLSINQALDESRSVTA